MSALAVALPVSLALRRLPCRPCPSPSPSPLPIALVPQPSQSPVPAAHALLDAYDWRITLFILAAMIALIIPLALGVAVVMIALATVWP